MFSLRTTVVLAVLILTNSCVFDRSGLGLGDGWLSDSSCETGSCRSDAQPDSAVPDMHADGQQPDQQSPDTLAPDTLKPDTFQPDILKPDTKPPCLGPGSAGNIQLACKTAGNCKQGSTTTGTVTYNKTVSFFSSFKWDSGQPVGFGTLTPSKKDPLNCNGTLNLSWKLPSGDLTTITLTLTFTGGDGKTFQKSVQVTTQ